MTPGACLIGRTAVFHEVWAATDERTREDGGWPRGRTLLVRSKYGMIVPGNRRKLAA